MHGATIAFAAGTTAVQFAASLPGADWLAISALALLLAGRRLQAPRLRALALIGAMALAGASIASLRGALRLAEALPHTWEGADIEVTGVIATLPALTAGGTRFVFDVEHASPPAAVVPPRISLSWQPRGEGAAVPPEGIVHAGERWRLQVRLKRPHGTLNFAGFDAESWLFERDLRAVGYVRSDTRNQRLDAFVASPSTLVERERERLRTRILSVLDGRPYAGVIVALTIGDQQSVPEAQWRIFNRTGISHLISISGLHITVFASVVGAIVLFFARFSTAVTERVPARKIAVLAGALAACAYTLLAGAEVPAQRTLIMLGVAAASLWLARPSGASIIWLWALVTVLLLDPWASIAPGFWLSFGAVGLLLYAGTHRIAAQSPTGFAKRTVASLREGTHAQWVVTVGLVPLTLALFQQVSLVAPLANAVAIPVVTFGVVSLALIGIVLPFDFLFIGAHAVFAQLMRYLEWLAQWPDAAWQQHAPLTWTIVAGTLGTIWLLAPRGVPGRMLGGIWLLPMFIVAPLPPMEGRFRLTVLDVGQGLSTVVQTGSHALLFDTGPRYGEMADAGSRVVAPNLRAMGVQRLDTMVISHADSDHSGGALSVLDVVPVHSLASSLAVNHPIVARMGRQNAVHCMQGQRWRWDGVDFAVLWPRPGDYDDPGIKTNDLSCVIRIDGRSGSVLLTGDIEARDEQALLAMAVDVHADVIVAPHHGSRTSSTRAFVEAVGPSLVVFTPGYRNRFGHPRPEVVARYLDVGAAALRSDADGAVELDMDGSLPLSWRTARVERRRYWHDSMEPP